MVENIVEYWYRRWY